MMRIISGSARGRRLAEFKGSGIRPTPDRVREALFSILISRLGGLQGVQVLELFAGTGALSLEALSRGAAGALLIDSSRQSASLIQDNIARCRVEGKARLLSQDAVNALENGSVRGRFDIIFMDPPYHKNLVPRALDRIDSLKLLAQNGIIAAETADDEQFDLPAGLALLESRRYGSSAVHLIVHADN